jgi:uncharacterized protein YndB with AHSA1/START domain
MKTFLKAIVGAVTALFVVVVGGSYLLPDHVTVQRQVLIQAPPAKVFALISSYKRFPEWSPWADIDPELRYTYTGPDSGVGQQMAWASNNPNVGSGTQTITEFVADSHLGVDLDLGAMGKAKAFWDLKPVAEGTLATWGFNMGLNSVLDRWTGLLMDRFVGPDYEKGLNRVKALAERKIELE